MTFVLLINVVLVVYDYDSIVHFVLNRHPNYDIWFKFTQVAMVLSAFRSASFTFENESDKLKDFPDFLEYLLYPPTFFLGPVIPYKKRDTESEENIPGNDI